MWKPVSKWWRKTQFQHRQSKIQTCGLYVVSQFGLALPIIGPIVTFPEDPILKKLSASMLDVEALGSSIVAALDYGAPIKKPAAKKKYALAQADFLDAMERYRLSIDVGKRRFESEMERVSITRKAGNITFNKNNRAHGRFAFEGTKSGKGLLSVSATAPAFEIGEVILTILANAAK